MDSVVGLDLQGGCGGTRRTMCRCNKSRVGERRADHDGQSSGAMTTGLAPSSVTAATNAPALRSSATVLWPVAWKFGDNQGRMCGMSVGQLVGDSITVQKH